MEVPLESCWLDDRVEVRRSGIDGHGLFATEQLAAGSLLITLGGRLVSTSELTAWLETSQNQPAPKYIDTITVYEDTHLVLPAGTKVHYGNHSCDPNVWHVGPFSIATRRDIDGGEEVTVDYATQSGLPDFRMECGCGSRLCRGRIAGDDWRRPELQQRYGDHWVPALLNRIRRTL